MLRLMVTGPSPPGQFTSCGPTPAPGFAFPPPKSHTKDALAASSTVPSKVIVTVSSPSAHTSAGSTVNEAIGSGLMTTVVVAISDSQPLTVTVRE